METIPLTITSKRIKYIKRNLSEKTKDLYSKKKNCKTLIKKKLKTIQSDGKIHHILRLEESILLK